ARRCGPARPPDPSSWPPPPPGERRLERDGEPRGGSPPRLGGTVRPGLPRGPPVPAGTLPRLAGRPGGRPAGGGPGGAARRLVDPGGAAGAAPPAGRGTRLVPASRRRLPPRRRARPRRNTDRRRPPRPGRAARRAGRLRRGDRAQPLPDRLGVGAPRGVLLGPVLQEIGR